MKTEYKFKLYNYLPKKCNNGNNHFYFWSFNLIPNINITNHGINHKSFRFALFFWVFNFEIHPRIEFTEEEIENFEKL